jgi:hypothetical protein
MSTPWCRRCKCLLHVCPDGKTLRDSEKTSRPDNAVVYVCTVCYHSARLMDGFDLSKPPE